MDRELVRSAMAGDRDAFDALASASIGRLYAVAALILRDPDRAADATQEALVTAWRDLSAIRDPDRFEAWMHRVLVRCCYREAGRERRRHLVEIHAVVDERGGTDASAGLIERDQLDRAFRRLDIEERTVIVLHHIEGFLLTEIADVLGIPVGTVKSRLHRGKRTMRAALDADARVVPIERGRTA
jgi:RNA polymerase sigma-70 factor, ECF subfamily